MTLVLAPSALGQPMYPSGSFTPRLIQASAQSTSRSTHLRVVRGQVAVVEAIQERADEPADFLAHFPVAVAVAGVAEDVLFPACQPVVAQILAAARAERWPRAPKMPIPREQAAGGRMLAAIAGQLKTCGRIAGMFFHGFRSIVGIH